MLNEKSLANAKELLLLRERKALASALFINYFGFISLFATLPRKDVKRYKDNEQDLIKITEENLDVSLAVQYALDRRIIPQSTAVKLLRFLKQFKQNKIIHSDDIDHEAVRELFILCKFDSTNKVLPQLAEIVDSYLSGDINLPYIARELYRKSRLPDIKEISNEFRQYFMYGSYLGIYNNLENGTESIACGIPKQFVKTATEKTVVYQPKLQLNAIDMDQVKKTIYGGKYDEVDEEQVRRYGRVNEKVYCC